MQILKTIDSQCQKIRANTKNINSLNELIESVISSQKISQIQRIEGIRKIIQVLHEFFGIVKANEQSLKTFIQQKAVLATEVIFCFMKDSQKNVELNEDNTIKSVITCFAKLNQISSVQFSKQFYEKLLLNNQNIKFKAILFNSIAQAKLIISILTQIHQQLINNKQLSKTQVQKLLAFLLELPHFNSIVNVSQSQQINKSFKKLYQQCLLKLLLVLDSHRDLATTVYRKIGDKILSKMSNPLILSDYFLNKFQEDPEIQIQVLSCLFILVGKYGLQFENFYQKLEKLIQSRAKKAQSNNIGESTSVYKLPNSKRFFKLVESALRSSKVPFKTISVMSKIIIKQVLQQQSEFTFWALSFFVNLTKKHRRLLDQVENMPQLVLLKKHYSPQIRALVGQLKKDLNKSQYLDIDQFSKINLDKLTTRKLQQVVEKLNSEQQNQFRIPALWEDL